MSLGMIDFSSDAQHLLIELAGTTAPAVNVIFLLIFSVVKQIIPKNNKQKRQNEIYVVYNIWKEQQQMTEVRIGKIQYAQFQILKSVDITFQNISYSVQIEDKKQYKSNCPKTYIHKQILNDVSGIIKSSQLTAIMGTSGAGKTTLLNTLACRMPINNLQGKVYANGKQYNFQSFADFGAYVMQTDLLMQTLTVRETLEFAANLKLDLSKQQKKERLNQLYSQLKLQKCLETMVGGTILRGISGGQRKRTSIAFQLISDPKVIMLDEPTSGLDSFTSFVIVKYLRKLAMSENKTIIMSIHQPSSEIFQLFDKLILLVDGQIIYQGYQRQAKQYFCQNFKLSYPEFYNPADYFISIMHSQSKQNVQRYSKYFKTYDQKIKPFIQRQFLNISRDQIEKTSVKLPFFTSLSTLLNRDLKNMVRNSISFKMKFLQTVFIGIYLGGLYYRMSGEYKDPINWQTYIGYFFFISIGIFMLNFLPVQLMFPTERAIFLKEEKAKLYSVTSYFISKNIVQIPQSLISPLILAIIMYWGIGLSSTPQQFFTFYLICYLIGFAGASLGLVLGTLVTDAKSVNTFTPSLILPFILFSGLFKNIANFPSWLGWIQYISPLKYSFSSFLQNEVKYASDSNIDKMNFHFGIWPSIGILVGLGITYRLLSLLFLWLSRAKIQ